MTGIWNDQGHAVDGAYTVCLQECPTHSHFDGLQVLSAAILPPCMNSLCASLVWRWRPIRFERIHVIIITDCVHTPDDCIRAPSRWGVSTHPRVAWAASTPSQLLRAGSVPNLHQSPIGDHYWSFLWFSNKQHYISLSLTFNAVRRQLFVFLRFLSPEIYLWRCGTRIQTQKSSIGDMGTQNYQKWSRFNGNFMSRKGENVQKRTF